jgi:hypothetical protein
VCDNRERHRRREKTDAAIRAVSAEPETYRYGRKNFRWGASCKTAAIVKFKQVLFRFGRNCSIPRQWPSGGTCFRMSLDARKRVPPLLAQTVLTIQWISGFEASRITSPRLPARRTAIPQTAKLEIPELRLIVLARSRSRREQEKDWAMIGRLDRQAGFARPKCSDWKL